MSTNGDVYRRARGADIGLPPELMDLFQRRNVHFSRSEPYNEAFFSPRLVEYAAIGFGALSLPYELLCGIADGLRDKTPAHLRSRNPT